VGLVLTTVFGVLSYVFYRRQLSVRQPRFFVGDPSPRRPLNAQGGRGDVVYEVVVWNGGRGAISALDLVDLDPLRIEAPHGTRFRWVRALSQRKAANNVAIDLSEDKRSGRIRLGFLNWRDGASFEVCIDGESRPKSESEMAGSRTSGPLVVGSILGVDAIKKVEKLRYVDEIMIGAVLGFIALSILIAFTFSIFVVLAFQVGVEFLGYLAPALLLAVVIAMACAGYYYFFYQDVPSNSERAKWVSLGEPDKRFALLAGTDFPRIDE
jgi:hypothetical protein